MGKKGNKHPFVWDEHYPAAVTVCDRHGIIIAMNRRSREMFAKRGGEKLIGSSLFDCHNPDSCAMIREQLTRRTAHVYITRSRSGARLIQQVPWYDDNGEYGGIVETVLPIDGPVPVRERS